MSFHRRFADNSDPSSVASRLRRRRFEIFRNLIRDLDPPVRVLDVGGTAGYWRMLPAEWREGLDITLLNVRKPHEPDDEFDYREGDARDLRELSENAFDVTFSNSVIEHVGDFGDQMKMAREVQRVGRRHYVQTPNRRFPIEPHFQFPLFQYLPEKLRAGLMRRYRLGWYAPIPDPDAALAHVRSITLLSKREFQRLFPNSIIVTERYFGLAKSFVAISPKPATADS